MARTPALWTTALVVVATLTVSAAAEFQTSDPTDVGMSPERLQRVDDLLKVAVEEGSIAGAVGLVFRRDRLVYEGTHGLADVAEQREMTTSTIFRIASMTKPITCAAVMILYEEGAFSLGDPVSNHLPEFADVKVMPSDDSQTAGEAARRPIQIRDLLTHTSGMSYHWNPRIGPQYVASGIAHGLIQDENSLQEDMRALAAIPLLHHPGERWTYGLSIDVLGRLVEVVSGEDFASFLANRIFGPLEMIDTRFQLRESEGSRLARVYSNESGQLRRMVTDSTYSAGGLPFTVDYPYAGVNNSSAGGGGLISTAHDYARFALMLENGGVLNGVRVLSRKGVDLMTSNHVGDLFADGSAGFGFGVAVVRSPGEFGEMSSPGSFFWNGFFGTHFWVDPQEELVFVLMKQQYPFHTGLRNRFRTLVYQAIED